MGTVYAQLLYRPEFEQVSAADLDVDRGILMRSLVRSAKQQGGVVHPDTIRLHFLRPQDVAGDLRLPSDDQWWTLVMSVEVVR